MITAGVDAGSRTIKVVLFDAAARAVMATGQTDQGVRQAERARAAFEEARRRAGLGAEDIAHTVATGYGRAAIDWADTTITEITCHARGARHQAPGTRTVIDIGGQDSKLIRLDPDGRVRDFTMNDRCAAGTGRFLELVAQRLEVPIEALSAAAEHAREPAVISSMCAVFAETEIVGLLSSGVSPENIVAGVQTAISTRIAAMAGDTVDEPILFTGGVALIPGMDHTLAAALGRPVHTAPDPRFTGALGAALLAARRK
jgi:(R)-2-hydroxyacyl-CoA dehydratese activating ATPase